MKIASFMSADGDRLGVVVGDEMADVHAVAPQLPRSLAEVLTADLLPQLTAAALRAPRRAISDVVLRPPISRPGKMLAIGLNYRRHVEETGMVAPEHQIWFNKQSTCVIGPGDAIQIPRVSSQVDYEGELAIVIGRRCRHVPAAAAADVIAGYTIANDVTVRDWQFRSPTWTIGKSFDTHGPLGPYLVTPEEIGADPRLELTTFVNDELRQNGHTDDLIFSPGEMIELLSAAFTLEPGDVLLTGTPSGVGMAFKPPRWLKSGDRVRVVIEGLGELVNPVVDEPAAAQGSIWHQSRLKR
jgi:2-keto-4-pentenoate hydratase/2-oxohepta-3-ene-1,7-dioic acid hydratase in catechol pathway